jgi:hypothetical protein
MTGSPAQGGPHPPRLNKIFMRYLISFIAMVGGFVMIWKTYGLSRIIGLLPWAEQNLGGGGTYILIKIIGILFILFGLFYMFGIIDLWLVPFRGFFGG